jgi:hypothetical protein
MPRGATWGFDPGRSPNSAADEIDRDFRWFLGLLSAGRSVPSRSERMLGGADAIVGFCGNGDSIALLVPISMIGTYIFL